MSRYEVFAVRYATMADRVRAQNLMNCAGADAARAMPMDYFLWVIRDGRESIIVDTGACPAVLRRRGRTPLGDIAHSLGDLGVDARRVRDVILTHAHYDHAGGTALFPNARFHLHSAEWRFIRGPAMRHQLMAQAYEAADLAALDRLRRNGRLALLASDITVRPGIETSLVGGHTGGTQVVRVHTRSGWLVLASDALHFRANVTAGAPFPIVADVVANLDSHGLCRALADADELVIAGHDPEVAALFPAIAANAKVFQLA
jgi:glyoxylase-like metal-dependent hydrolase (beta-lactamase superfamily II)